MKIELKNIKYAAFASEETSCFEATLYIDGVRRGSVRNDGRGGPDLFDDWKAQKELDAYGATLPVRVLPWDDPDKPGEKCTMPQDAESLVNDLLHDYLTERDFKRLIGSRLLWLTSYGDVMESKKVAKAQLEAWLKNPNLASKLKDCTKVLNTMPYAEALALFKAALEKQAHE